MDLLTNMSESDYKILYYHYADLKVLIVTRDVKLRYLRIKLTQISKIKWNLNLRQ